MKLTTNIKLATVMGKAHKLLDFSRLLDSTKGPRRKRQIAEAYSRAAHQSLKEIFHHQ